jgi:hypothetical protein
MEILEKFVDLEQRMEGLADRSREVGVLTERKRIADFVSEEYASAFAVNSAMAPELYRILNFVLEREDA